jgi:hypothetical protein
MFNEGGQFIPGLRVSFWDEKNAKLSESGVKNTRHTALLLGSSLGGAHNEGLKRCLS